MSAAPVPERAPLSRPVPVDTVPGEGRAFELRASAAECRAVAAFLQVDGVAALEGDFVLAARAGGVVSVRGQVRAEIAQTCVVTLEPMVSPVRESVDLRFAPATAASRGEVEVAPDTPDADDPPEPIEGGRVDLGMLAVEHLALGIDPYPRKAEAVFRDVIEDEADARSSPFAALKGRGGREP